jgi:hypothetical protein
MMASVTSSYVETFTNSNGELRPLPENALKEDAKEFAREVYRVFAHPRGFDLGSSSTYSDDFLVMVWAGFNFYYEPDTASIIHKYRNLAYLHEKETSAVMPLWEVDSPHIRKEAYFLEYAIEAVADAWCEKPLTSEQITDIAERAMEYACKKPAE